MISRVLFLLIFVIFFSCDVYGMTRQQLKNSSKMLKKNCMGKNDVTEDLIGEIDKGKFIEERNVMCYIACVFQLSQTVKNNKLNYEASIKQVDMMFPPDIKEAAKAAIDNCKDTSKKYKDLCESSYWTAKCMYDYNPEVFLFP
ncbi:general odorant-binding protein 72-like [Battus philenor]|uniref:general odorant-binding protein 72-like n=1 Tax=Battus philenor TaxID=42288 RepID=UPI0035CF5CEE